MQEKIALKITQEVDADYQTPQYVKDAILEKELDKLFNRPWMSEKDKYSLGHNPQWENKHAFSSKRKYIPQTSPPKPTKKILSVISEQFKSGTLTKDEKAKIYADLYVCGILLKTGAEVALMHKGVAYDLLVLTAKNRIVRLNVIADRNLHSPNISIEIFHRAGGETVTDIHTTLADHYIIKICGTPGVYQIATDKLKQILKTHEQKRFTLPCEGGNKVVTLIERKLLLANCEGLNL